MAKITNELLKKAVADADAVRDTAIANAKLALEESITPAIKEMLAKRLRHAGTTETGASDEPKEVEKKEADADKGEMKDESLESSEIGTKDNKDGEGFETSDIGQEGGEVPSDQPVDGWYDDWSESDFDLDEIIKELESGVSEDSLFEKSEEDEMEADSEEEKMEAKTVTLPPKPQAGMEGDEEGGEEEMAGGKKKLDLEALIRELVAELSQEDETGEEEDKEGHTPDSEHEKAEKAKMATEIAELRSQLSEYEQAVAMLSNKLQEVHLLNTKLLYTNKLFQKGKLTNEQSAQLINAFDRATTLREVKMVYALMVENLSMTRKPQEKVASRKTVVTEGFASKATPSTAPKQEMLKENSEITRLQYLAGIKKG